MLKNLYKLLDFLSKPFRRTDILVSYVLIPLGILTSYFISSSWLLPSGVNNVFVTRSGKYLLAFTIFLYLVFFIFVNHLHIKKLTLIFSVEKAYVGDLTLLLLPLTPVVQYIIINREILSLLDSLYIFSFFAFIVALFILILPILLSIIGSRSTVMLLGLAFTFSITNMATLTQHFAWYEVGSLKVQLPVFSGVFLVCWFLYLLNYRRLLYLLITLCFLTNSISQIVTQDSASFKSENNKANNRLVTLIASEEPIITPSIYLLIYDAYVTNETMLAHGIDNRAQEQYLENQDFQVYPGIYSVGADSISTMSRVLNASVEFYDDFREGVSGNGVVQNLLRQYGYKTYGIFFSDYFFRGINPRYQYFFPDYASSSDVLLKAILMGEFRFDINFDEVSKEQFSAEKIRILSAASEAPRFIYMHTNSPGHSQNSGACLPNEVRLYEERLFVANLEMRQDVEMIIENDPEAVVILAGDHGPYLTKNCRRTSEFYDISEMSRLDIQDRFGTFLAIKWPSGDFDKYDDIVVLQDVFPVIFAYIFQDRRLLESKIEPMTLDKATASGAMVVDGLIEGGIHSGEPLFIGVND